MLVNTPIRFEKPIRFESGFVGVRDEIAGTRGSEEDTESVEQADRRPLFEARPSMRRITKPLDGESSERTVSSRPWSVRDGCDDETSL
jgi:hypothetical protein